MYNHDFIRQLEQALEEWRQGVDNAVDSGIFKEYTRGNYKSLPGLFVRWVKGEYDFGDKK